MSLMVFQADYRTPRHAAAIVALIDEYARDPMGGGHGLAPAVRAGLVAGLARCPTAFTVLAVSGEAPAGLANCFEGFSTFMARPLINVHDLAVSPRFRGQGIGRALLEAVAGIGRERGACKLTLEVREANAVAQSVYRRLGFSAGGGDGLGATLFWQLGLDQ